MFIGFISDNAAGAHPRILEAVLKANKGYCLPYGDDEYCAQAQAEFRKLFGPDIEVFLASSAPMWPISTPTRAARPSGAWAPNC